MIVLSDIHEMRDATHSAQQKGQTTGLVPTMGALHRGHLSLIESARANCDLTVVSIFVNPTQFGPTEDFDAYPRPITTDLSACEKAGVDIVFTPTVDAMYPPDSLTTVHVDGVSAGLCGLNRPTHFDGVATVVAKLFGIVPADRAYFGEKDYQQVAVIRRMARDLNLPIEIVACPTVREPDGMALSSRNAYLSADERRQAIALSRSLFEAAQLVAAGERDANKLISGIRERILSVGLAEIDYAEIVDVQTLERLPQVDRPARICLAVRIGGCRLIDNVGVDATTAGR